MAQKEYHVALIGYGLAGSVFHAPLISRTEGMQLKAIVTSSPERMSQAKHDFPGVTIFATTSEMFANKRDYDIVVIAAPNKFHHPLAKESLEAGLATIVDKPMATSVAQVKQLMELSQKLNIPLSIFHNRLWDNDFLTVRKLLDKNILGPISRFESRFERYRPAVKTSAWRESASSDDAGGLLFDLGSHLINQACFLFGTPLSVYAEVAKRRPGAAVDDDAFVALQFPNNITAHLWAHSLAKIKGPRFRVNGLNGTFEKFGLDPQEEALKAGKRPGDSNWGVEAESQWGTLSTTYDGISFEGKVQTEPGRYEDYYANVRDALQGNGDLAVKPADALLTARIIEAAFESASQQKVVVFAQSIAAGA